MAEIPEADAADLGLDLAAEYLRKGMAANPTVMKSEYLALIRLAAHERRRAEEAEALVADRNGLLCRMQAALDITVADGADGDPVKWCERLLAKLREAEASGARDAAPPAGQGGGA